MAVEGYTLKKNGVPRTGPSVDALLDKIDNLSEATTSVAGLMSASDKTKLNNIESGANKNVQPDWEVSDTTSDAYIKNKPKTEDTPTQDSAKLITSGGVWAALEGKQGTIDDQVSIGQAFGTIFSKSTTTRINITDFVLTKGGIVSFYNGDTSMPQGTLKINSGGSEYPIYKNGAQATTLPVGVVSLMFDGSHWQYLGVGIVGIDSIPTSGSVNLITSGGTYAYVQNAISSIDLSNYYTKSEIDAMIGDINSILEEVNGESYA